MFTHMSLLLRIAKRTERRWTGEERLNFYKKPFLQSTSIWHLPDKKKSVDTCAENCICDLIRVHFLLTDARMTSTVTIFFKVAIELSVSLKLVFIDLLLLCCVRKLLKCSSDHWS